jgi:17beta-estradiol 17-dehydrogenase / very-long-chain 3-oxoacyl-CoA reductase
MQNIIRINCEATLRVTQIVLPRMIPQKKGLVLTMGSFGGLMPTPLLATYAGSKAFLQAWSHALAGEVERDGITVHFVHAYLVTRYFTSHIFHPTPFIFPLKPPSIPSRYPNTPLPPRAYKTNAIPKKPHSAMSKVRRPSLLIPNEKAFVRSVLSKIGRRGGSVGFTNSGSPYWTHAVFAFVTTGITGVYSSLVRGINLSMHVDIRKRALRKREREAKKL